ncbi:hypothetical protein GOP47_0025372 [Adiantum capillus-veneris]|uniref:Uncharacterized protein n=1 Tax=Adiantum capillus-veneris TaxID=13818 RepID=A0A9D4U0J0_ADICA|nr:hypothetical protein GOP47_0025372 [Adiantum capillus-veneris]
MVSSMVAIHTFTEGECMILFSSIVVDWIPRVDDERIEDGVGCDGGEREHGRVRRVTCGEGSRRRCWAVLYDAAVMERRGGRGSDP